MPNLDNLNERNQVNFRSITRETQKQKRHCKIPIIVERSGVNSEGEVDDQTQSRGQKILEPDSEFQQPDEDASNSLNSERIGGCVLNRLVLKVSWNNED